MRRAGDVTRARQRAAAQLAGAGLLAALAACSGTAAEGVRYEPAGALPRLQHMALPAAEAGSIVDFDLADGRLYLLERPPRIHVLERRGAAWSGVEQLGRAGGGPGELDGFSGLTVTRTGLLLTQPARVRLLAPDGRHLADRELRLPCPMLRPAASVTAAGMYVAGTCLRAGYGTDTMKAVLAWAVDSVDFAVVAEDLAYTRDGRSGSVFGASRLLTTAATGVHAFGAGTTNCVWRVDDTGGTPTARQLCPAAAQLYTADPPPEVAARLRRGVAGMQLTWPATLPVFVDRFVTDHGIVLVRPFLADSVVLQLALPEGRDLAVAPLDGFVGCKAAGCLWLLEDQLVARVIVLDAALLDELAGSVPPDRQE